MLRIHVFLESKNEKCPKSSQQQWFVTFGSLSSEIYFEDTMDFNKNLEEFGWNSFLAMN